MESPPIEPGTVGAGPELRPSGLGMLSLACSLLSVLACVVITLLSTVGLSSVLLGLFALPVIGLAGVALGAVSLLRRRAPDGAVYTRGPAVAGVIIGLASAVLQGSFLIGAVRSFTPIRAQVVPVVASMAREVEAGRPARARDALGQGVRGAVSDRRIADLFGEIKAETGDPVDVGFDLTGFFRARTALMAAVSAGGGQVSMDDFNPKPVEFRGPSGAVPVWVLLDEQALSNDKVRVIDMMALLPGEPPRVAVLMPDGRFRQFADQAGLEAVPLDEDPG